MLCNRNKPFAGGLGHYDLVEVGVLQQPNGSYPLVPFQQQHASDLKQVDTLGGCCSASRDMVQSSSCSLPVVCPASHGAQ
jgi:hypothetical protein